MTSMKKMFVMIQKHTLKKFKYLTCGILGRKRYPAVTKITQKNARQSKIVGINEHVLLADRLEGVKQLSFNTLLILGPPQYLVIGSSTCVYYTARVYCWGAGSDRVVVWDPSRLLYLFLLLNGFTQLISFFCQSEIQSL